MRTKLPEHSPDHNALVSDGDKDLVHIHTTLVLVVLQNNKLIVIKIMMVRLNYKSRWL